LTFFTLPTNYSVYLHKKIFSLIYASNGGFNWHDVYYMPTKLREFYWNELVQAKDEERKAYEDVKKSAGKPGRSARK
jgi:hypothetical protein